MYKTIIAYLLLFVMILISPKNAMLEETKGSKVKTISEYVKLLESKNYKVEVTESNIDNLNILSDTGWLAPALLSPFALVPIAMMITIGMLAAKQIQDTNQILILALYKEGIGDERHGILGIKWKEKKNIVLLYRKNEDKFNYIDTYGTVQKKAPYGDWRVYEDTLIDDQLIVRILAPDNNGQEGS